ncbi:MAG: helix-turn-helix transcriptional regulator [Clostridia bacterium]|nr:helix-turn-helix transcriptional regulator [Clostridia bacterium]
MKTFGENLKALRKFHKISQKDFAEKMQTTQQRVSEWECNKVEPSLYNIIKILRIFDVSFEELTDGIEEKTDLS